MGVARYNDGFLITATLPGKLNIAANELKDILCVLTDESNRLQDDEEPRLSLEDEIKQLQAKQRGRIDIEKATRGTGLVQLAQVARELRSETPSRIVSRLFGKIESHPNAFSRPPKFLTRVFPADKVVGPKCSALEVAESCVSSLKVFVEARENANVDDGTVFFSIERVKLCQNSNFPDNEQLVDAIEGIAKTKGLPFEYSTAGAACTLVIGLCPAFTTIGAVPSIVLDVSDRLNIREYMKVCSVD